MYPTIEETFWTGKIANMESWSWYNLILVWLAGFGILAAAYNMGTVVNSQYQD